MDLLESERQGYLSSEQGAPKVVRLLSRGKRKLSVVMLGAMLVFGTVGCDALWDPDSGTLDESVSKGAARQYASLSWLVERADEVVQSDEMGKAAFFLAEIDRNRSAWHVSGMKEDPDILDYMEVVNGELLAKADSVGREVASVTKGDNAGAREEETIQSDLDESIESLISDADFEELTWGTWNREEFFAEVRRRERFLNQKFAQQLQ
jgi:hypothetical protein